jgi:iron complex outermembrane receptor protein
LAYGAYSHTHGTAEINTGFNIPGLQGVGFCVDPPLSPPGPSGIAVSCNYYRNLTSQAQALGPRATAPGVLGSTTTKTFGIENTTRYDLNDELTLRNIVSYQQFKNNYYYDGDGTIVQQYDSSLPSDPLPRDYIEDITEEIQLQGNLLDKRLTFTTGFVYYDQKPAGPQGVSSIVYCPALYTGYCAPTQASIGVETQSDAAYAQGTLDLGALTPSLDGVKLTGGYRYTWDTISGSAYSYSTNTNGTYTCASSSLVVTSNPTVGCSFSGTLHSAAPNWTVGLDDTLWDSVLVYGKISHGYKAGGFNSYAVYTDTRTFTPEYVTSYEIGAKSDFKLATLPVRLNGDYYFLNYDNIQKATGDYNPASNASGAVIRPAQAQIQGVELEATIRPFRQLEIGGTFSYTDFNIRTIISRRAGFFLIAPAAFLQPVRKLISTAWRGSIYRPTSSAFTLHSRSRCRTIWVNSPYS